jgi:hypothetical protein
VNPTSPFCHLRLVLQRNLTIRERRCLHSAFIWMLHDIHDFGTEDSQERCPNSRVHHAHRKPFELTRKCIRNCSGDTPVCGTRRNFGALSDPSATLGLSHNFSLPAQSVLASNRTMGSAALIPTDISGFRTSRRTTNNYLLVARLASIHQILSRQELKF